VTPTQCCADTGINCAIGPAPGTDGCAGLTSAADQQLCVDLYNCLATNSAATSGVGACSVTGDVTNCFCGTAPSAGSCFTVVGAANGLCAPQFIAAAKTTDPATIQNRFQSPLFPIGRAVNLNICRGSLLSTCGIN
jgi:hypothetical protein